jgi:hypothetical protein
MRRINAIAELLLLIWAGAAVLQSTPTTAHHDAQHKPIEVQQ